MHSIAARLPTVSASATEAPPWSTPNGWCVRSFTGMVARRKSGPISVTRMPRKPGSVRLPRSLSSAGVAVVRQMLMELV